MMLKVFDSLTTDPRFQDMPAAQFGIYYFMAQVCVSGRVRRSFRIGELKRWFGDKPAALHRHIEGLVSAGLLVRQDDVLTYPDDSPISFVRGYDPGPDGYSDGYSPPTSPSAHEQLTSNSRATHGTITDHQVPVMMAKSRAPPYLT